MFVNAVLGEYHTLMKSEKNDEPDSDPLRPLLIEQLLDKIPIFGANGHNLVAEIVNGMAELPPLEGLVRDELQPEGLSTEAPEHPALGPKMSISDQMKAIRKFLLAYKAYMASRGGTQVEKLAESVERLGIDQSEGGKEATTTTQQPARPKLPTHRELHEKHLMVLYDTSPLNRVAKCIVDNLMLFRARALYVFNFKKNIQLVSDDPWLSDMWAWMLGMDALETLSSYLNWHQD